MTPEQLERYPECVERARRGLRSAALALPDSGEMTMAVIAAAIDLAETLAHRQPSETRDRIAAVMESAAERLRRGIQSPGEAL